MIFLSIQEEVGDKTTNYALLLISTYFPVRIACSPDMIAIRYLLNIRPECSCNTDLF
jgi:hypothetical protein